MKRYVVLGMVALGIGGCDSGPSGPGEITATLRSPAEAVGGIVAQVVGSGIEGFSGAGGSKVFFAQQDDPSVYRVIVITEGGGDLSFTVAVRDLGARMPRSTIVGAVDPNNLPLLVTKEYQLKFKR